MELTDLERAEFIAFLKSATFTEQLRDIAEDDERAWPDSDDA